MKTIINRVGEKTTVVIDGETISTTIHGELKMIKYPKMECFNSRLYHLEDANNKHSEGES